MKSVRNSPAWLSLLGVTLLAGTVQAACYNFTDGQVPGQQVKMHIPPKVLTEGDNHFLRITGHPDDHTNIPKHLQPTMNRSIIKFGSGPSCSGKVRFMSPNSGTFMELHQQAKGGEPGYASPNGTGPVFRCQRWGNYGHCQHLTNNEKTIKTVWKGALPQGQWHHWDVRGEFDTDGFIELRLDGKLLWRGTGNVNLGDGGDPTPVCEFGLYAHHAAGVLDVDDVCVGSAAHVPSPSPTPPSPPVPPPVPEPPFPPVSPTPVPPHPPVVEPFVPPTLPSIRPVTSVPVPPSLRQPKAPKPGAG